MAGRLLVLFAVTILASCSTVKSKRDPGHVTQDGIGAARELEQMASLIGLPIIAVEAVAETTGSLLKVATLQEKTGNANDAAGNYLAAAIEAKRLLIRGHEATGSEAEQTLFQLHNASLARFAEIWGGDSRKTGPPPYYLSSEGRKFEIVLDPASDYKTGFFDESVSADSISGKGVSDIKREGYGATLVGIRHKTQERADEMKYFSPKGLHLPVTLTITGTREKGRGESRRTVVSLAMFDPTRRTSLRVGGHNVPLAGNFSAPMLMMLDGRNEALEGLFGFLNAKKRAKEAGIYLLEPYDPNRIPVVLTHGLISVPIIWREIVPELLSEPEIAKRYQIFAFTYPSSYALVESAELFRNELKALREKYDPNGRDPLSRNMVAMGHSMGGMLTHMLVTDFGDNIWKEFSDVPFDQFPFEPGAKKIAHDLAFFDYDKAVRRAVFISTPHRGANMAKSSIAGLASQLVALPKNMLIESASLMQMQMQSSQDLKVDLKKKITSVQSLRPDSPIVLAMDKSPFKPGVIYHSIIGDRGKGDSPNSSDGVVDYWSSHLDGAASELIVPTNHKAYHDPKAIEELKRILRIHVGLR